MLYSVCVYLCVCVSLREFIANGLSYARWTVLDLFANDIVCLKSSA